jgi:hypothetical protein
MSIQNRPSWGDDDDSLPGSEPDVVVPVATTKAPSDNGSGFSGEPRYKISYTKHNSTYARTLYDVEGNVLTDEKGNAVNVFMTQMKDMLEKGDIICYHVPGRPGYRYFCTYKKQGDIFKKSRRRGQSPSTLPYHVYPDEPGCILPYEGRCPTTAL